MNCGAQSVQLCCASEEWAESDDDDAFHGLQQLFLGGAFTWLPLLIPTRGFDLSTSTLIGSRDSYLCNPPPSSSTTPLEFIIYAKPNPLIEGGCLKACLKNSAYRGQRFIHNFLSCLHNVHTRLNDCATKVRLSTTAAKFKGVPPCLCCCVRGESGAIAALQGGNKTQDSLHMGRSVASAHAIHHAHYLFCICQEAP